jgi:hypothetical protein
LVVEARGANIEWTEPRDLTYDGMSFVVNDPNALSISCAHPNGPYAVVGYGVLRDLHGDSPEVLKKMLTVRDGDQFPGHGK